MSDRIERRFASLAGEGRAALIPFVTAGDPDPEWTVDVMHALVDAGADILEIGVPFSDPTADGWPPGAWIGSCASGTCPP